MENYNTLKTLLDSLFEQKDISSWTVHENKSATQVILRFSNSSSATRENSTTRESDMSAPRTTVFRRKSESQVKRDRQRREHFYTKRITRSQTTEDPNRVELLRGKPDDDALSAGVPAMSPELGVGPSSTSSDEPMLPLSPVIQQILNLLIQNPRQNP